MMLPKHMKNLTLTQDLLSFKEMLHWFKANLDLAESAYRQAFGWKDKPNHKARLGLALYFADQGEWRFADPLFAEDFSLAH